MQVFSCNGENHVLMFCAAQAGSSEMCCNCIVLEHRKSNTQLHQFINTLSE